MYMLGSLSLRRSSCSKWATRDKFWDDHEKPDHNTKSESSNFHLSKLLVDLAKCLRAAQRGAPFEHLAGKRSRHNGEGRGHSDRSRLHHAGAILSMIVLGVAEEIFARWMSATFWEFGGVWRAFGSEGMADSCPKDTSVSDTMFYDFRQ